MWTQGQVPWTEGQVPCPRKYWKMRNLASGTGCKVILIKMDRKGDRSTSTPSQPLQKRIPKIIIIQNCP